MTVHMHSKLWVCLSVDESGATETFPRPSPTFSLRSSAMCISSFLQSLSILTKISLHLVLGIIMLFLLYYKCYNKLCFSSAEMWRMRNCGSEKKCLWPRRKSMETACSMFTLWRRRTRYVPLNNKWSNRF